MGMQLRQANNNQDINVIDEGIGMESNMTRPQQADIGKQGLSPLKGSNMNGNSAASTMPMTKAGHPGLNPARS